MAKPKQLALAERRRVEAQENLLIDFQFLISSLRHKQEAVSCKKLARESGLSEKKLKHILSAESDPKLKDLAAIFDALKVRVVPRVTRR